MNKNGSNDTQDQKTPRHFLYFVLDADRKEHPMPPGKADAILEKLRTFLLSHQNNRRRNRHGKD